MAIVRDGKLFERYPLRVIMVCCCLVQAFGMGLILNCGSLFYVPVCTDLGFSRSEISTYMTGYFIGTTLVTPLAGKLLSKYDTRIVMSVAIVVLSGAVASMSLFHEIWQWQVSGFFVGAAGSCIFVLPSASFIGNWFIKRRGFVYGIVMAFSSISAAIFSQVLSFMIQSAGWRFAYLFVGVVSLAVILPCSLIMRKRPSDLGMNPYGHAQGEGGEGGVLSMRGVSVKVAVVSVAFWCLFAFAGIASFIHGGIEQHMPGYIESIGFTASFAALVVSAESLGSMLDKFVMGWLNDKIGVQFTVNIQLGMVALGFLGFIFAGDNLVMLYVSAFLFGAQNSLVSVSTPLLIRQIFGERDFPAIFTYARIGTGVIGCLGPVTVAGVFDVTGSFVPAFALGIVITALGFLSVRLAYAFRSRLHWIDVEAAAEEGASKLPADVAETSKNDEKDEIKAI